MLAEQRECYSRENGKQTRTKVEEKKLKSRSRAIAENDKSEDDVNDLKDTNLTDHFPTKQTKDELSVSLN